MWNLLALVGLAGVIVAVVALIRGRVRWAWIGSRKVAAGVLGGSFLVFVTGAAFAAPAALPQHDLAVAPPSTTNIATASSSSPVPVETSYTPSSAPVGKPVVTAVAPPPPAPTTVASFAPRTRTPVPPSAGLSCTASMSDPHPADYATTDVLVHTGRAGASVTATAHYKTTDTTHSAQASGNGDADITFHISRATPGFTVYVDIAVTAQGETTFCSTFFTPRCTSPGKFPCTEMDDPHRSYTPTGRNSVDSG